MNQPFGFSASDDDGRDENRDREPGDSGGPGGFGGFGGAGGFDPSQFGQFGQMLSQFGQMLGSMGSAMSGPGSSGPVNYQLARTIALQALGRTPVITDASRTAAEESVRLAELWLDETTVFPTGVHRTEAWTPQQWVEKSLPTWEKVCTPVAEQMSSATRGAMPEEARQLAGPLLGMLDQMGGLGFGMQLGQGLGRLAPAVLFSSEVGLPFGDDGVAALCPSAIDAFADELELPRQEVVVFLAAREAAHLRLFAGAPWLRARILATVDEYAKGIRVDTSGLDDLAAGLDPSILQDPTKLQELLSGGAGAIGPKVTNVNEAALGRLETLLALVEGWVDAVVTDAVGDRLPSADKLRETWLRRRAAGGAAEQAFSSLVGLELRPRLAREASELWRRVGEAVGTERRDGLWSHPDLLPVGEDLENPAAVIDRLLDESSGEQSGVDEIERFLREAGGAGGGGPEADGPEADGPEADGPDRNA
ncbi:zinc-dependent metalloprotease [Dietzia sp. UBA5065]|jgi:putative hydrolase|uniref:zinc-dependent metalloprotease n=1 Tax=Dietzia sp. UBA5065 TaxID=1946422 RepID=UPI0025C6EF19|nr:zinc-dependent metalloprotease [Dietzia sp. UBA5065]HMT50259.1 zinc-dependent metalloprotease [Dietzia sp.]